MVVETARVELPEPFAKVDLLDEVKRELGVKGCQVVEACRTPDCEGTGVALGATDAVRMTAEYNRQQLSCSVVLEVHAAGSGGFRFRNKFSGATCPAMDFVDRARELAAGACEQLLTQAIPGRAPASAGALQVVGSQLVTPHRPASAFPHPGSSSSGAVPRWRPLAPWPGISMGGPPTL